MQDGEYIESIESDPEEYLRSLSDLQSHWERKRENSDRTPHRLTLLYQAEIREWESELKRIYQLAAEEFIDSDLQDWRREDYRMRREWEEEARAQERRHVGSNISHTYYYRTLAQGIRERVKERMTVYHFQSSRS